MARVVGTDRLPSDRDVEDAVFDGCGLDVEYARHELSTEDELIATCAGADALIVAYAPITARVLEAVPRCRSISFMATGFNSVDMAAATRLGIVVTHVPDYCTSEVADHTLGFLLDLGRNISRQHRLVAQGVWEYEACGKPQRLGLLSVGLIGLGRIGKQVALRARAFGLRALAYDPYVDGHTMAEFQAEKAELDDVLQCDYVSLHCLLSDETRRIIDEAAFKKMKPEAFLINTARGACVDCDALAAALAAVTIAGAALDVTDPEPLPAGHPLYAMENVIMTPHVAFLSRASEVEARRKCCEEVVSALSGKVPRYVVNPEVLERENLRLRR